MLITIRIGYSTLTDDYPGPFTRTRTMLQTFQESADSSLASLDGQVMPELREHTIPKSVDGPQIELDLRSSDEAPPGGEASNEYDSIGGVTRASAANQSTDVKTAC